MPDKNITNSNDVDSDETWFLRRTFNNNQVSGTSSRNTMSSVSSSAAGDKNNKGKADKTVTPSPTADSTVRSSRAARFHRRMKKRFLSSSDGESDAVGAMPGLSLNRPSGLLSYKMTLQSYPTPVDQLVVGIYLG